VIPSPFIRYETERERERERERCGRYEV
jgi:hypothetical protein